MKKRILLAVMLMCIAILAVGTFSVSAAYVYPWTYNGTKYGDYLYYIESNGKITITDCDELATVVEIPKKINGKSVTSIGNNAFGNCSSLTSVTIPDSVTSIGSSAFRNCSSLTSVTIPDSVTSIGYCAFENCSSLTSVTIPNSVTSIGYSAFYECKNLTTVRINDLTAYLNCNYVSLYSNPMYYAKVLRLNGKLLNGSLEIPKCVTKIPQYSFKNCTGLTSVTIPDSVTSIGSHAFSDCSSLTSVAIPESVTSIGEEAFEDCRSLERVNITDLKAWCNIDFEYNYFYNYYSNPLYYAEKLYLNGELVENLVIPDGVTKISNYAFYNCESLTSVTIPDSVTNIEKSAFKNCSGLTSVNITDLKAWCNIDFGDYYSNPLLYAEKLYLNGELVENLVIPNGVTKISDYAFPSCSSLTSVTIPNSVTSIAYRAFYDCSSLTSVTIPISMEEINEDAFYNCRNLSVVYYSGTDDDWANIYIASGNDALKNATRKTGCDVKLVIGDDAGNAISCQPGTKIKISDIEKKYMHKVTLYTDKAMTKEFDTSTAITGDITLYVKLGEEITIVPGDVTGDGKIDKKDVLRLQKYLAGHDVEIDEMGADVNGDGNINKTDVLRLKKYLAGQNVTLGK